MAEKDPSKITLAEASELYSKEIGTSKISTFGKNGKFKKYGNVALVDVFKGEQGNRIIDEMLNQTDSPGAYNTLADNLRLISKPVRRRISRANPSDPYLNTLPGLESKDEQTKIIFGEKKVADPVADIAIDTTKRKGLKEFFDQIDAIADDPKNPKQALANAFRSSYFSGNRIGLMTNLQGSEYLIDRGALSVEPQTKKVGVVEDQETRAGASKAGGFRKKAIPYTVPLNENAHAYLQMQLKNNQADPEIAQFIREEAKKGKAPIFVHKVVAGEGDKRKVKFVTGKNLSGLISDMLGDITVSEEIVVDNQSKKGYNSLFPKELKTKTQGKWGSALSRNIHASIAVNELRVDQQMIDFLHGRSLTSGAANRGQTAKLGYAKRPVGSFFQSEKDAQQTIGNWINGVQGKDAAAIPDVQNRVSKASYALEGFFDQPESSSTSVASTTDGRSNFIQNLLDGKVELSDMDKIREKRRLANKSGGGKLNAGIIGGVSAVSGLMSGDAEASANVGTQMIGEEVLERGTIEMLKKAGLAARSANPVGVGLTIAASTVSTIGEQAFEKEDRVAKQLGISRNDILGLSKEQKEKLYGLVDQDNRNKLSKEQEKISLGEQMRSLSSSPATRSLDSGVIETDPAIDEMLMSGQI
tara:strand:- start:2274 stop:4199 length:1926 start_codon:yes stop_codon:yes gene_type:complete